MKRQGDEGDLQLPNKRPHLFPNMLRGVLTDRTLQDYMPSLEPFIRKMVKEEVNDALIEHFSRSSDDQIGSSSGSRPLQLQFHNNLPLVVYTGNKIVSEDGSPLTFALYDSASNKIVTCGPYSSMKAKIVVLEGDFDGDFDAKVVHNRQGKRPLITGEPIVSLQDGTGYIHDVTFTDNSSWTRSGKFRLGVKIHSDFDGSSIREGVSNAFRVKDQRGASYEKHYPPSLDDEVWRLEKIAKDGTPHKRLTQFGVSCVRDFLRAYALNEASLRAVLPRVSNKKWETIIKHAMTCPLDDKTYIYRSPQGAGLVFNSIYKAIRVTFDGLNFHSVDRLDSHQTKMVEGLKQQAYRNLSNWEDLQMNNDYSTISLPLEFEVEKEMQGLNVTFDNSFGMSGSSESLYIGEPSWMPGGNSMEAHDFTEDDDF